MLDKCLDEASITLGANSCKTALRVIAPLMGPAILAALTYSFVRAITSLRSSNAMAVPNKIIVMNNAENAPIGTPARHYDAPSSAFPADFIGDENLADCIVDLVSDDMADVTLNGHCDTVPARGITKGSKGRGYLRHIPWQGNTIHRRNGHQRDWCKSDKWRSGALLVPASGCARPRY